MTVGAQVQPGEQRMITGRCICGNIRYEIDGRFGPIVYCHCSMCRRATGSACATNASVRVNEFRVVVGSELISEYESSPSNKRAFCSRCGSPLYCRKDGLGIAKDCRNPPRPQVWVA